MTAFQTPKHYMEQKNIVKTTEKDEPIPDVWKKNNENARAEKRPAGSLSHYLQGFIYARQVVSQISSINTTAIIL